MEKCHYGHRGKPRLHEQPIRRSYHAQATLSLNMAKVELAERAAGRFVLATNGVADLRYESLKMQFLKH